MTNPYETPVDTKTDVLSAHQRKTVGIEFQSDWSPQGLRQRRRQHWYRVLDLGYAAFCLLWIVSLVSATGSPYAGLFCVLTPIWILLSVIWFSNINFRNGESFHRKYPGLAGQVYGKVDNGTVVVRGPQVSFASSVRACLQCDVTDSYATILPPGFQSSLPIIDDDITRHWPIKPQQDCISPSDLLSELVDESNALRATGTVRGSDLKLLPLWRRWLWIARTLGCLGILAIVTCVIQFLSLPEWIIHPPGHYQLSESDINQMMLPVIFGILGLGLLSVSCWQWTKTWRQIGAGEHFVSIGEDRVAIANNLIAFSYYGEALQHFRWTDVGLVVRDAGRQVLFAIPARWFDNVSQEQLATWYGRETRPPRLTRYLGPKI